MNINELICNMFDETKFDIFYVHKPDGYVVDEYITFNFTMDEIWKSDNDNEMDRYFITLNFITKDISKLSDMIIKIKKIIKKNELCYGFMNRGTIYNKDSLEFFNASTFYLLIPNDNYENISEEKPSEEVPNE